MDPPRAQGVRRRGRRRHRQRPRRDGRRAPHRLRRAVRLGVPLAAPPRRLRLLAAHRRAAVQARGSSARPRWRRCERAPRPREASSRPSAVPAAPRSLLPLALGVGARVLPPAHRRAHARTVLREGHDRHRHQRDPRGVAQHRERLHRAVLDRPRRVHGRRRLHGGRDHVLRVLPPLGKRGARTADSSARRRPALPRLRVSSAGSSRRSPASSSACRRCGCAATTSRS